MKRPVARKLVAFGLLLQVIAALSVHDVATAAATPNTRASIVEMAPADRTRLGRQESLYVRIEYTSDEPVHLWARPYLRGVQVENAMSNASAWYSGNGEALGWFALRDPGEIDEVRIRAGGGDPYHEWDVVSQRVRISWTSSPAPDSAEPKWVGTLVAEQTARMREDQQRRAQEPVAAGSVALFSGFMALIVAVGIAGIVVPFRAFWKWRGGWRVAAAVPAALIGFVILRIIAGTAIDPTSHNLWPFEILQFGVIALVITAALKLARRWVGVDAT